MNTDIFLKFSKMFILSSNQVIQFYSEAYNDVADKMFDIQCILMVVKGYIKDFIKTKDRTILGPVTTEMQKYRNILSGISQIVKKNKSTIPKFLENAKMLKKVASSDIDLYGKYYEKYSKNIITLNKTTETFEDFVNKQHEFIAQFEKMSIFIQKLEFEELQNIHKEAVVNLNKGFAQVNVAKKNVKEYSKKVKEYEKRFITATDESTKEVLDKIDQLLMASGYVEEIQEQGVFTQYLKIGNTFVRDLFNNLGIKMKAAFRTFTESDIYFLQAKGIKSLYYKGQVFKHESPLEGKTIYIIYEDKQTRNLLSNYFEALNFQVLPVENGLKAFLKMKAAKPQIIIYDLDIVEERGFHFFNELKNIQNTDPILTLIVADEEKVNKYNKANKSENIKFFPKPVSTEQLKNNILKFLNIEDSGFSKTEFSQVRVENSFNNCFVSIVGKVKMNDLESYKVRIQSTVVNTDKVIIQLFDIPEDFGEEQIVEFISFIKSNTGIEDNSKLRLITNQNRIQTIIANNEITKKIPALPDYLSL